ncbi:MAG: class I tRNA ligase family protein [Candidatus Moranbacteria bacterium]|nr:class I tRNA ligase family protein [Candidatus Moranbacteria bacterium]
MKKYNPKSIEAKWQKYWRKKKLHNTSDSVPGKKNFILLTEFPYPSGNLHIGHWYAFAVPDILARFLRFQGKNVMYPMGFDAFGLPAENAAIKRKLDPKKWTEQNIKYMADQFETMGASFDWSRSVSTIDSEYYKWTQWIFLEMLKNGLARKAETTVNWCPGCKTVLANEQVVNGACERCDAAVEQKKMAQWLYRTTAYADKLTDDLEKLDWPESTKLAQKNWIGRSEGTTIKFKVKSEKLKIKEDIHFKVFTTRLDTIYGCTYCVLAPEHPLVEELRDGIKNYKDVEKYIAKAKKKTELERTELQKEKTGVELKGVSAINPFTNEAVPIFVADYVLGNYGTGAVMAVPAHDERDWEFAKKYKLPVKQSIAPHSFDEKNPPRKGKKNTVRKVVHVLLTRKNGDVLTLNLKGDEWGKEKPKTFVIGGIEDGESPEKTALREVREETGYADVEVVKVMPIEFHAEFFAAHKDVNRYVKTTGVVCRLKSEKRREVSEEEKNLHELVWVKREKLPTSLTIPDDIFLSKAYLEAVDTYAGPGVLIDSGKYSGLDSAKAREEMAKWLEKNRLGKKTVNYRLHDWVISRQRYWGAPIPVVYCEKCGIVPVPEKDLPVKLPPLKDFLPTGDGKSPLAKATKWVNVKCPKCGSRAERETDTMDTFVDSSWYFLRYADPKNKKKFAERAKMKKWLPVPLYIGGAEHNTMHLLYSRFFTKVLNDLGHVDFDEPFVGRRNHGTILGPDNQKMSKSRGNVIDPDEQVKKWGADSVRMYLAFMGPYDQNASWQMTGIVGVRRFLERVWKLKSKISEQRPVNNELESLFNKTIKKVTEDIENLHFNTAISSLMILLNELEKQEQIYIIHYTLYIILLSPFAPHVAEEIWSELGHGKSIFLEKWPKYDPKLVQETEATLIIQVNGKVRDEMKIAIEAGEREAKGLALQSEKIQKYIPDEAEIRKIIFVPGRLINFVL